MSAAFCLVCILCACLSLLVASRPEGMCLPCRIWPHLTRAAPSGSTPALGFSDRPRGLRSSPGTTGLPAHHPRGTGASMSVRLLLRRPFQLVQCFWEHRQVTYSVRPTSRLFIFGWILAFCNGSCRARARERRRPRWPPPSSWVPLIAGLSRSLSLPSSLSQLLKSLRASPRILAVRKVTRGFPSGDGP